MQHTGDFVISEQGWRVPMQEMQHRPQMIIFTFGLSAVIEVHV